MDSRRPGSCPTPRALLGELYLDSMGIIRSYFPGQLSERLQVRREGLPLETPPPHLPGLCRLPGCIVPGTMAPAPSKTRASPLAADLSRAQAPGKHLGSWTGAWGSTRMTMSPVAAPRSVSLTRLTHEAGGEQRGNPSQQGAHPWPSKPSCPRCAVSRHLAGGPGAPRATTHGVTSSAGRAGAVPPRVEALPPPSLPSPSHTQTGFQLPPVCSGNRPKPPPIRPWDPLRMKPPRDVRDGNRGGRRPAKNPRWSFAPASSTRVSQVPAWALPWGPARRRVTYPERCPRPADQLPGLSLELGELRVAVTAPSASTGRVALLCARPGALGRRAAAAWVLLRPGGQPLAGAHFQQLQRLPGRAALGHLRGGRGQ